MTFVKSSKTFERKWGPYTALHYYTQIPNKLLRNLGKLNLGKSEAIVLLIVISYGENKKLRHQRIANEMGADIKTVKKALKGLEEKSFIERKLISGESYRHTWNGLVKVLDNMEESTHTPLQKTVRGVPNNSAYPPQKLGGIKDKEIDLKESINRENYKQKYNELIKKRSV